jgi:hypothetical protein
VDLTKEIQEMRRELEELKYLLLKALPPVHYVFPSSTTSSNSDEQADRSMERNTQI